MFSVKLKIKIPSEVAFAKTYKYVIKSGIKYASAVVLSPRSKPGLGAGFVRA